MAHIRILFYTFIWKICPELITEGYVYAGLAPLYRIVEGKDKFTYLWDDKELALYQESHIGKKYEVFRFKGLGEMNQDETSILIDPNTRKWEQITVKDVEEATKIISSLMGDDVDKRRDYLLDHALEAELF